MDHLKSTGSVNGERELTIRLLPTPPQPLSLSRVAHYEAVPERHSSVVISKGLLG
jgi:hypothetical protein